MKGERLTKRGLSTGPVRMKSGEVLDEADFEAMASEVENLEIDIDRLLERRRRGVGRPPLGDGVSPVLHLRLDEQLRQRLVERAEREQTTPSSVAREAIRAFLAS